MEHHCIPRHRHPVDILRRDFGLPGELHHQAVHCRADCLCKLGALSPQIRFDAGNHVCSPSRLWIQPASLRQQFPGGIVKPCSKCRSTDIQHKTIESERRLQQDGRHVSGNPDLSIAQQLHLHAAVSLRSGTAGQPYAPVNVLLGQKPPLRIRKGAQGAPGKHPAFPAAPMSATGQRQHRASRQLPAGTRTALKMGLPGTFSGQQIPQERPRLCIMNDTIYPDFHHKYLFPLKNIQQNVRSASSRP